MDEIKSSKLFSFLFFFPFCGWDGGRLFTPKLSPPVYASILDCKLFEGRLVGSLYLPQRLA